MSRTLRSSKHQALRRFVIAKRKAANLRQVDVAKRLGRYQSYITNIETGQRRIDVVELIDLAEAIGFDPREAIKALMKK
jgi:transcriptional regulator with XRE-family HTH domain